MTSDILIRLTPDVVASMSDEELEEILAPLYPAVRKVSEVPIKKDKLSRAESDLRAGRDALQKLLNMAQQQAQPKP